MPTPVDRTSASQSAAAEMKCEIDSAVSFLTTILRAGSAAGHHGLSADQLTAFRRCLETTLVSRYRDHWFPDRPQRGSAYRCVRIVNRKLDRLLASAATAAGVPEPLLERLLPTELTLWVDPDEVSGGWPAPFICLHPQATADWLSRLFFWRLAMCITGWLWQQCNVAG